MSKNWENVLISPEHNVRTALKIINDEALRIAIVVDENRRLLGVVTDGDIRRGILNNIDLDASVTNVMNVLPKVASSDMPQAQLINMMVENGILAIPIIDHLTNKIIGLETLEGKIKRKRYDNPVFIMAGGFGTRLRPLTDTCPKPMLKVGDKPILETLLLQFIDAGFHNIFISTHYMADQITEYFGNGAKWGVNIEYVFEKEPLGTGGALGLLPKHAPQLPLIMINGDVLTTVDLQKLLHFHNDANGLATMCVREYEYQVPYGVIEGNGNRITSMVEKPVQRFFVNAGIYVIEPAIFKNVPENHKIDMPSLLEEYIASGHSVMMFPVHEYWLDIGRMDDFNKAQLDYKGLFK
ncbi:nucleotidyltransferase family protein [uncultured Enterobacter sp.]|uniref:nucleotidyltransferase family protein n=1 Tax=uncultured Enterobacter sp. TaxID=238202 RepID=UPI00261591E7|nr:nucleotidyltransferase family protein [uncultured Enterobacter sp.]